MAMFIFSLLKKEGRREGPTDRDRGASLNIKNGKKATRLPKSKCEKV